MSTRQYSNYADLITFSRASGGTALRPVSYGDELVTNGAFDTDLTGWTQTGTVFSQSGGELVIDSSLGSGGDLFLDQAFDEEAGKIYKVSFEVTSRVSGQASIRFRGGTTVESDFATSIGVHEVFLVGNGTNNNLSFVVNTAGDMTIDNVSIKEVLFDQPTAPLTLFNHPANIPRIEYDADGNRLGLLIEEQRTNLITYSEDFSNALWSKTEVTITPNAITAPDGTSTADKISETAGTNVHTVSEGITASSQTTVSVWMKAAERSLGFLRVDFTQTFFDLENGVIGTDGIGGATIKDAGNGWYKCSVTTTDTSYLLRIGVTTSDGLLSYTGDGTSGIYVWGAQVEEGSFPTSYIPTSGSTATRAVDFASISVADFGYNQKAGTVFVEVKTPEVDQSLVGPAYFNTTSFQNSAGFCKANAGNTQPGDRYVFATYDGENTVLNVTDANTGDFVKLAGVFGDGTLAVADGGTVLSGTEQNPVPTHLRIGGRDNGYQSRCHIKSINYYPRRLTNAQLQELTS